MVKKITAKEFAEKVELLEGVVMAIWEKPDYLVDDYDCKKRAAENISIADWLTTRVTPKIGEAQIRIIDGSHSSPHRGQRMDTLRKSYLDK